MDEQIRAMISFIGGYRIMIKKIKNSDISEMQACDIAVVDYSASWCGPCKMMAPVFDMTAEAYEGKAEFFSADVDENEQLAAQNKIFSVPTLVIYKKGVQADQSVGAISRNQLESFIDKNL